MGITRRYYADGSSYVDEATKDVWRRVNGAWLRIGNVRDEGVGGIVGVVPRVNLGFDIKVSLTRTQFLGSILMDMGFSNGVDHVDRIRELSATLGYGYAVNAVLSRVRYTDAALAFGFDMEAALTIVAGGVIAIEAEQHFGFDIDAVLSHEFTPESIEAEFNFGFDVAAGPLFRTTNLVAAMAMGFSLSTSLSRTQQAAGLINYGFSIVATLSRTQTASGALALGFNIAATVTHTLAQLPGFYALSLSSPFVHSYTSALVKRSNPASLPTATPNTCSLSPDGTLLAVAGSTNATRIYDVTGTGAPVLVQTLPFAVGTATYPTSVAWSPDGQWLIAGTSGNPGVGIRRTSLWDTATWTLQAGFAYPNTDNRGLGVGALAWAPDSSMFALANGAGNFLYEFDVGTWAQRTAPAVLPTAQMRAVSYSPDGRWLAALQGTGALFVYRRSDMARMTNATGYTAVAVSGTGGDKIAWAPDSSKFVVMTAVSAPFASPVISIDTSGNMAIIGTVSPGGNNPFVFKFNAAGTKLWFGGGDASAEYIKRFDMTTYTKDTLTGFTQPTSSALDIALKGI